MAREYSLNTEFEVVFDNNLNVVSNVNIGSIPQTSNDTFSIRVKVPTSIIDVNNDSCYLALVLPTTNKNARLKLPTTLFNDFVLNEDGSYYESVFSITANAVRYVGKVLINLVVRHNTGVQEEQVIGDTELLVDVYTSKSSSTFSLIVTRSSNYSENLYPDEEDEYEEAVDHINAIMDSLSGFASRFIDYKNGIIVVNNLPENVEEFDKTIVFEKSTNNLYLIDTTQESGKVLIANLDLADVADKDFVYEAIRNAIANKLDYETNTDKRVIIKSSNDDGVALVDTINNNRVDVTYDGVSIKGKVTSGLEVDNIFSYEDELVLDSKANDFSLRSNKNAGILDYDYDDDILNYNGSEVVNKKYVETLEKQIENLKANAEGNTFNYETDSSVAYEKVVPANASPYASLNKVGGMSYKSKNILDTSKTINTLTNRGITFTKLDNGGFKIEGTNDGTGNSIFGINTSTGGPSRNILLSAGIYTIGMFGNTTDENIRFFAFYNNEEGNEINLSSSYNRISTFTLTQETNVGFSIRVEKNSVANNTVYPYLVRGEIAPTEFEPYFEGIRNTKVTNVKIVGENIFDFSKAKISANGTVDYDKQTVTINANTTIAYLTASLKEICPSLNVGDTLYINAVCSNSEAYKEIRFYGGGAHKYNTGITITETYLNDRIGFYNNGSSSNPNTVSNIIFSKEPITTFKPYYEENLPILDEIQQLDGYGMGRNEEYYNYIDYDRGVWTKKYGKYVFTGNEVWKKEGSVAVPFLHTNLTGFDDLTPKSSNAGYQLCNYFNSNSIDTTTNNKGIQYFVSRIVRFRDDTYNTPELIQNFCKQKYDEGNPLVIMFPIEPIETDISHLLKEDEEIIKVEGNGSLTFENEHKQAVGSEVTYEVKII